ncbi:hypothetical protein JOQ06_026257 [Pogonophryne albipinna]|uniref:IF rod domain-containing protein n=1 Tax=Pogonophryne albipinna TaxID=1090488 RepID=A0AAD6A5N5_9TELE|nr:hypothetical protein JOQ06_026262 [Pogonophryne albipinna]KAJ4919066.1 hypothetical protein JOQ06_026257 [Pogonophryne albipinna]
MELHKSFHLGDEKHQMLNLNRRLETYLSRVKLLEQENALLEKEIEAMRCSNRGVSSRRKGLEEEMLQVRLEMDSAWRERVFAEKEVCKVAEELQNLDFQRQREAEAQLEARKMLEQSRKELEEEQRAQMWLREKVNQLEQEMMHLIQTHQEDVGHMEAEMSRSRANMTPMLAQRGNQTLDLLQVGQDFSQRATRAWQVEAEVHQTQLDQLEETLNQSRSRLSEVNKERKESEMKLRALEKEMDSARDVRKHLERNAQQQGDGYREEIQTLQEHWESLEAEKEELSDHIDHLLLENRGLQQQKVALGLEVATYRALLDAESLRGDISLSNHPRNISDAGFSPRGVTKNDQSQMSTHHKTTSLSSVRGITGRRPTAINSTPTWIRKHVTVTETPKTSTKSAYEDTTKSTWVTPYPKILQDGAIENFRPQEVQEKVTYAEPLSPPNEQEAETTPGDKEGEEDWNNVGVKPREEGSVIEPVVSYQVESALSKEPAFNEEVSQHQFTAPSLTPYHVKMSEEHGGFSDDSERDLPFDIPQNQHAPIEAWVEKEWKGKEEEHVREERSDSEAEAVIEPNYDSRTGSARSECEPEENVFNIREEITRKEDAVEMRQEIGGSLERTNELEDRLYPDGEEMDTWDSVIERKVDVKTEDGVNKDEEKQKHAEPEEDISARDHEKREMRQGFATDVQQDNNVSSAMMDTQVDDEGKHAVLDQDDEEEDEEEDSQNVSVSWRTEVESDSYAQENTLADTRPLIRYKSDECDANTHASHPEESECSEGEQEKKIGELGSWSEGKSKRFGTMEDLCEEVEGEALDEDYNLGYSHIGDRDVEQAELVNEEERIGKVSEGHSEEAPEELTEPTASTYVDYDEELETDRLVEQELENLATDSYSAHFAQQQVSENEEMQHLEMPEKEDAGKSFRAETEVRVNHQLASSTTIIDQAYEKFSDWPVMPQALDDEEVQNKDREAPGKTEEEDEHNASMVTHADVTEDYPDFTDFIRRPDMEEVKNSDDPKSVLEVISDQEVLQDVKEVAPVKSSNESQESLTEDVTESQEFPQVPETAEWEVLENPSEDSRDQSATCENVTEQAEGYLHDDGVRTHQEKPLEMSPDSVPDEKEIFVTKDSSDLFSSGLKNDFWSSSLETGATYQPDDVRNEAAEQTNQNLGFADNMVWGSSENVDNWISREDIDSSKTLSAKKEHEQMHSEVKQVLGRNVVEGEGVHSDESDAEEESWSSEGEPV